MSNQKPPYIIVARKPTCGCILFISAYRPDEPQRDPELPKEIANCVRDGLLIQTLPFDQNPLQTERFGCDHKTGQLALTLE